MLSSHRGLFHDADCNRLRHNRIVIKVEQKGPGANLIGDKTDQEFGIAETRFSGREV